MLKGRFSQIDAKDLVFGAGSPNKGGKVDDAAGSNDLRSVCEEVGRYSESSSSSTSSRVCD